MFLYIFEIVTTKTRFTMAQPPKLAIISTRPSMINHIDAKRRETKQCITKLVIANANVPCPSNPLPSVSSSTAIEKQTFRKPTEGPLRSNKIAKSNSQKCQYCDKCFVKSCGMETHLLERCDKIPASVRRQLLQKTESCKNTNSKQISRETLRQETDSIWKYSRFFINMSNEGTVDTGSHDVEESLKILQAELRKNKSSHTGIMRTPNKPLRCHICKKLFLDCVEYADHISNHPSN